MRTQKIKNKKKEIKTVMEKKSVIIANALKELTATISTAMAELVGSMEHHIKIIKAEKLALREDVNEYADITNTLAEFVDDMGEIVTNADRVTEVIEDVLDNSPTVEDEALDLLSYEDTLEEEDDTIEDDSDEEESA